MNTTEINGFEIDNFNQYDLDVGKREGICPLCSHTRQPKNQKAKCAMYDWERGLGTCMNCNEVFQLHTFKRQSNNIKEYTKPEWKNNTTLSDNVIKWFEGRSISQKTLVKMKITEGVEFMPQTGKSENTIQFNYFINNELINIKYRDGRKNFKLVKGAEKVFYNIDRTIGHDYVVIVEGEMDALSFVESGIESVVSVPNGATINNTNLDYLDSCIDYFESKEKVILAVDADEAGLALKQELIRRLGAEKCFTVELGTYKDANEFLMAHGRSVLADVINKAKPVPIENVVTLKDINDELEEFIHEGFKPGYQIGLNNKMYKKEDGTIDEPTMYSIKGGGEWYDASYHGLLVHRNYEQKTVKVKVLKVKFQNLGENQAEAHFKWDHMSGDYMPIEETNINAMPWEVD
jgi:twinkle protein